LALVTVPLRFLLASALLALVASSSVRADEAAQGVAPRALARAGLTSPVAAEREAAVRAASAHGGAARTWARAWVAATATSLRSGGWRVLGRVGAAEDLRAALRAVEDRQPEVARRAAEAVVTLALRLPLDERPWIPAGALDETQERTLAYVLARTLAKTPAGAVPPVLQRLGEGIVPSLMRLLEHPRFDDAARRGAVTTLAAIGGDAARRALASLVPRLEHLASTALWASWWRALIEVGPGRGLAPAQALVVAFARSARGSPWPERPPGLRWRNQVYFYRFVASVPPADGIDAVRAYLDARLKEHATSGRFRIFPSMAADVVRAHLVVVEPTDERLAWDVLAARPPPRNGWRRRQEELGKVLMALEPYKARAGVQRGLRELLAIDELPKTVKAWALYLQGATPKARLWALAEDLIDAGGTAVTLEQRRLGGQLLDRLGTPDEARIGKMSQDIDGWMRALGLRWAARAVAAGDLSTAAWRAALSGGLEDADPGVFLLATELSRGHLQPAQRERVLTLALEGARTWRGRAWKVVEACLAHPPAVGASSAGGEPVFEAPQAHAALDERLRAAARVRRLWREARR